MKLLDIRNHEYGHYFVNGKESIAPHCENLLCIELLSCVYFLLLNVYCFTTCVLLSYIL
jgi:hypothetical protein